MQEKMNGGGPPPGQGGRQDRSPGSLLKMSTKAHNIFYPIATHHLLEDLDTMWNLWYTHKLPMKWWLEDRAQPCQDLVGKAQNSEHWPKKKDEFFRRLPQQMHVEIFCKSYEYERYLVRTNRGDDDGNWRRPSDLGHVHRIPLKFSHFDLMPDGDTASTSDTTDDEMESLRRNNKKISDGNEEKDKHPDILRKEAHLQEKKDMLREQKRRKHVERKAKTEATRYRARSAQNKFTDMFAKSAANVVAKEITVEGDGSKSDSITVRGISLDEI